MLQVAISSLWEKFPQGEEISLQRLSQKGNLMILFLQLMEIHLNKKFPRMFIIRLKKIVLAGCFVWESY
uniref:Uncharacterized protein n=1 Tax=Rhizophora mucronata TaxID=61149 RepID=A0A2P2J7Q4_RHIMU